MKRYWEWNSRYWEQFALLKLDQFAKSKEARRGDLLNQAISHAKHAVQVERHPLPLTTLGKILLEEMKQNSTRLNSAFNEAYKVLTEAILLERRMNRIAIHPYITLFGGANYFARNGGALTARQADNLGKLCENAETFFSYDMPLMIALSNLRVHLLGNGRVGRA
jgi:hypothetical protein